MKQFAPAAAQAPIVSFVALIPPSTSMSTSRFRSTIHLRIFRILSVMVGMYFCPPKPGLTVMTRTWSTRSRTFSIISAGVWGFSATEGDPPAARIRPRARCRWVQASAWTMTTPGSPFGPLETSTNCSSMASVHFSLTISCVSKGMVVYLRHHRMVSGPKVRLGTKFPSMTSNCTRSHPASSNRLQSAPSFPKSAGRTEGMICTLRGVP
mmetsp:Transcript_13906/g.32391  ORF Transcript_13906/g.32391 Transcript_13906/m.32391 type:complete len:209 (+) Transcript_13906:254-880(+)